MIKMNNSINSYDILITGANGFVGKELVSSLLKNTTCKLLLIDQYFDDSSFDNHERIERIEYNITNQMNDLSINVDVVVHLASIVGEQACTNDIDKSFKVNSLGTNNIINCLNKKAIKKFILLSTSNVYSMNNIMPVDEEGYTTQVGIYAMSKLISEAIVLKHFANSTTSYYICRMSNVYGPNHNAKTIINQIQNQIINNKTLEIVSPDSKRNFLFIDDAISGILTFIENEVTPGYYNIGGGDVVSINDIVNICSGIVKSNTTIIKGAKKGDILTLNSSKLMSYGWNPQVNIYNGLKLSLKELIKKEN